MIWGCLSSPDLHSFIVVAIGIWLLLRIASRKGWAYLRLAVWCVAFTLIGYSTYITTMIRSNADPSVDMYNVDNPMSLVGYLGRDQYGDFPILYGQTFNAQPADFAESSMKYEKGKDKYIEIGKDIKYVYMPQDKMVFPRMWDASNDQEHADYYAYFMGIGKITMENMKDRQPLETTLNFYQLSDLFYVYPLFHVEF